MSRQVLHFHCLPTRIPLHLGATLYLLQEHFDWSGMMMGFVWAIYAILFLGSCVHLFQERWVKPFVVIDKDKAVQLGGEQ